VSVDTDFVVGKDKFEHITVSSTEHSNFYWFYNTKSRRLIKQFVLQERLPVAQLARSIPRFLFAPSVLWYLERPRSALPRWNV
jgi:hypothetical protein